MITVLVAYLKGGCGKTTIAPHLAAAFAAAGLRSGLADVDRLIVDAPAAMKLKKIEALLGFADVIVVPVLPSGFDEPLTGAFLKQLEAPAPSKFAALAKASQPSPLAGLLRYCRIVIH